MVAKYEFTRSERRKARELVANGAGVMNLQKRLKIGSTVARRLRDECLAEMGKLPPLKYLAGRAAASLDAEITSIAAKATKEIAKLRLDRGGSRVQWSAPEDVVCGITIFGDIHKGDTGVAYEAFDRDTELVLNTPGLYAVLAGDAIDNAIKYIAAMIAAGMSPEQEWRWLADWLERISPKLIAIVGGNHEWWTAAMSGYDPLKHFASQLALPYDSHEIEIDCTIGGQKYIGCVRHKYRFNSSFNAGHTVKRLWEMGDVNFDWGVVAHNHTCEVEPFVKHRRVRWVLRPGTYQVLSAYAHEKGFHGAVPIMPTILMRGDRRDMLGVAGLQWAAEYLSAVCKTRKRRARA